MFDDSSNKICISDFFDKKHVMVIYCAYPHDQWQYVEQGKNVKEIKEPSLHNTRKELPTTKAIKKGRVCYSNMQYNLNHTQKWWRRSFACYLHPWKTPNWWLSLGECYKHLLIYCLEEFQGWVSTNNSKEKGVVVYGN